MARRILTLLPFALPGDGGMLLTRFQLELVDRYGDPVDGYADGEGIAGVLDIMVNGESEDIEVAINDTITPDNTSWKITVTADGKRYKSVFRKMTAGASAITLETWVGARL